MRGQVFDFRFAIQLQNVIFIIYHLSYRGSSHIMSDMVRQVSRTPPPPSLPPLPLSVILSHLLAFPPFTNTVFRQTLFNFLNCLLSPHILKLHFLKINLTPAPPAALPLTTNKICEQPHTYYLSIRFSSNRNCIVGPRGAKLSKTMTEVSTLQLFNLSTIV